jgi:LuxR family transcriptional regulator, maltose regulon positive regulatory protein
MTAMIGDRSPGPGLAQHDPQAATATLPPLLDGSILGVHLVCVVAALLLEAIASDAPGNPDAATSVLERALDLAERDRMLVPFLVPPAPPLFEGHAEYRTAPATVISEVVDLLARVNRPAVLTGEPASAGEALTRGETRVLRYLPTNLSARKIADELYLSVNTVKTHQRHLYQKLGARSRHEAVERARARGLLAASSRRH